MNRTLLAMGAGLLISTTVQAEAVRDWLQAQQAKGQIASAAVAAIDADRIESFGIGHRDGKHGATPDGDTRFQIGSITKVFTNLLLAEQVAVGAVTYDTAIASLLPTSFAPRNPALAQITLQALATHRSGLPRLPANLDLSNTVDPYADYDEKRLHKALASTRDKQPLGNFYTYSNFGVGLLGSLLGAAEDSNYQRVVAERVIAPLNLSDTGFESGDNAAVAVSGGKVVTPWGFDDALAGAGALWGSVNDLARLTQVWIGEHAHALKHDPAQDLDVLDPAGDFEITRVWHVARADGAPVYWHNGGTAGFHSFVGFRTDTKKGIAILVSGDADPTSIGLKSLGVAPITPKPAKVDQTIFGQFALSPQFGIGVFERDGVLQAQATGQPAFELHPVGDDWYALGGVDASLHFIRKDGRVTAMELAQNGVKQRASRVAETATATSRKEVEIDAETRAAYAGEYAFAPGVALTVRDGKQALEAQLSGQPFFPVYPRGDDRFFYKVVDAELQFERDAKGKVKAVLLHQAGVEQRAKRSSK